MNIHTTEYLANTENTDKMNIQSTEYLANTENTDKMNIQSTEYLANTENTDKIIIQSTEYLEKAEHNDKINVQTTEELKPTTQIEKISSENNLNSILISEQNLCDEDCEICEEKNNSNCLSCKSPKILNEGKCVSFCENDEFIDNNGIRKCKCKNQKCLECSEQSLSFDLCISCNENYNYYQKLNDTKNRDTFINCYNNLEKYYLKDNIYEPCYESCQSCDKSGNSSYHNCKTCDSSYKFIIEYNEFNFNCYKNCTYYHYFDYNKNKYYCTQENKCPDKYNKLILEKNECIDNCTKETEYIYEFKNRCYKQCPANTEKIDNICKLKCTKEYPFENVKTQQCVSNCSINEFESKICIKNYIGNETNDKAEEEMVNNVQQGLTNGYNTSNIDNGEDVVIEQENSKSKVTISNTENQKKIEKERNNITTINLGECETKLKNHYKIPEDKNLYILKIDVPQEGTKIVKIGYEVYYPLNGGNLVLLNLSVCQDEKVDISIPIDIDEDLDKLNSSSDYYNDICYTSTSENGTDISLKDRQKEFVENNKTVCEENCDFSNYNYDTGKAVCSCEITIKLPLISEIKLDKNKLYNSFTDIKNIANINIMKCYKLFFSIEGIKKNYGCYILIPIFLIHIISTVLFYLKDFKKIGIIIKDIIFAKKNWITLYKLFNKEQKKIKNKKENAITKTLPIKQNNIININNNRKNNHKIKKKKKESTKIKEIKLNIDNKEEKNLERNKNKMKSIREQTPLFIRYFQVIKNMYQGKTKKTHPPLKKQVNKVKNKINLNNKRDSQGTVDNKSHIPLNKNSTALINQRKKYEFCKKVLYFTDYELNYMAYKEAIKNDHRSYCSYYLSLLRIKHLLIFSFFPMNDYNSRVIKVDLFFINFTTYYTVNALFFSDSTMHKIYQDGGSFDFIYQLPQILYSSLISGVINLFLKTIALIGINIIEIKHCKAAVGEVANKTKKIIKYKLISYFIISHILLLLFWYYVGCFCTIYKNTQLHLIKDSVISFGLSFIYPFFIYLLPGILRIPSLKKIKDKKETMYNISKLLQAL